MSTRGPRAAFITVGAKSAGGIRAEFDYVGGAHLAGRPNPVKPRPDSRH